MKRGRYTIRTDIALTLVQTIYAANHAAELELTFDINAGYPETRIQPGEPASVSIQTATVNGKDAPDWLWAMIEGDDALEAEMIAEAWESDEAARDDHADMLREERLLGDGA